MEVAGPLGTPLGLAQRKRASPRGEAGTSGFPCVSDSDRRVPAPKYYKAEEAINLNPLIAAERSKAEKWWGKKGQHQLEPFITTSRSTARAAAQKPSPAQPSGSLVPPALESREGVYRWSGQPLGRRMDGSLAFWPRDPGVCAPAAPSIRAAPPKSAS